LLRNFWYPSGFVKMCFRRRTSVLVFVLLVPLAGFGQLPSSACNSSNSALAECTSFTQFEAGRSGTFSSATLLEPGAAMEADFDETTDAPSPPRNAISSVSLQPEHFHWRRALTESFTFLVIEQAYVIHSDFSWVVSENGVPFNHYWRDYMQSLSEWTRSGWNDGDPNWYGYVGHPIQGALTGFIQIQNDPQGQRLEFSKTKAYWWSRFKAALWNAAYSTQWNLGPVSEVTVEKYGTKTRGPWNYNGTFPCTHHCLTGVGQIDIVMTPLGGTGWLVGEDFLDNKIVRRVEGATQSHFLIDAVRCALNPIRGGANILHGEAPWYRASRDVKRIAFTPDRKAAALTTEALKPAPSRGDVFFGYSHIGTVKCQTPIVGSNVACNPFSSKVADLGGWNASVEKNYLRYFGAVADFGHQYGSVSETNYLFGLRGGAWFGRVRPFAEALVGAVRAQENGSGPDTSFAEALGIGADVRVMRLLGWRIQAGRLKTQLAGLDQQNLRVSSGLLIRF